MMMRSAKLLMLAAAATVALAGCARQISPNTVDGAAVGEAIMTYPGRIAQVRTVQIQEGDRLQQNRTGALLGGLAGGVAGSAFGAGWGQVLAAGAGAVAGAALGSVAEREVTRQQGFEYTVQLDNGQMMTVVQGTDAAMSVGQRVFVQVAQRGRARVIPAT